MPKCLNDPTRTYKGSEPSPKGLGYCGHAEKINTIKKGADGNKWIINKTKAGIKRWVKVKNTKLNDTTINTKNRKKLSKIKANASVGLYDIPVILYKSVKKTIFKNKILKKIIEKVVPEIKSKKIKFYIVPFPIGNNNLYWSDYPVEYVKEYYGDNYLDSSHVIMTVKLQNDLEINFSEEIILQFQLNLKEQQVVYDAFMKYLPYNYSWNGNEMKVMTVNYKDKTTKSKKLIIKPISNFPMINVYIDIVNKGRKKDKTLFDVDIFTAQELKGLEKLKQQSNHTDYSFGTTDLQLKFLGVKDTKLVENFFKKIKKTKKLTVGSDIIEIKRLKFYRYNNEKDVMSDTYFSL